MFVPPSGWGWAGTNSNIGWLWGVRLLLVGGLERHQFLLVGGFEGGRFPLVCRPRGVQIALMVSFGGPNSRRCPSKSLHYCSGHSKRGSYSLSGWPQEGPNFSREWLWMSLNSLEGGSGSPNSSRCT